MISEDAPRFWQIVQETIRDFRAFRSRALLALVGVAIGTAAVISMLHIGHNAKVEALRQLEALGTDLVMIVPQANSSEQVSIALEDVEALPDAHIGIDQVSALIQSGTMVDIGHSHIQATVLAATGPIFSLAKARLFDGRETTDLDGFAPYAVVGSDLAASITAASGTPLSVSDKVRAGREVLTVIGLLSPIEYNNVLGIDLGHSLVIPFAAARRLMPAPVITNIAARLTPGANDIKTAAAISAYFQGKIKYGAVSVNTARQMIAAVEQQMRIYALLILAIGAVSLVVGGVGIMNVMLMSVMERRQEIGLRQAIGARRKDIRLMFLCEALLLSLVGSIAGTIIGYLAGWIFALSAGWQFDPAPTAMPLGLSMALLVGLFFGIYPATRASLLHPITALRSQS